MTLEWCPNLWHYLSLMIVTCHLLSSLSIVTSIIIYNHNKFIVQATGVLYYKTLQIRYVRKMDKVHSKLVFYWYCQSFPLPVDKHTSLPQNVYMIFCRKGPWSHITTFHFRHNFHNKLEGLLFACISSSW